MVLLFGLRTVVGVTAADQGKKDDRRQQQPPKSGNKLTTGHSQTKAPSRSQRCEGMKQTVAS